MSGYFKSKSPARRIEDLAEKLNKMNVGPESAAPLVGVGAASPTTPKRRSTLLARFSSSEEQSPAQIKQEIVDIVRQYIQENGAKFNDELYPATIPYQALQQLMVERDVEKEGFKPGAQKDFKALLNAIDPEGQIFIAPTTPIKELVEFLNAETQDGSTNKDILLDVIVNSPAKKEAYENDYKSSMQGKNMSEQSRRILNGVSDLHKLMDWARAEANEPGSGIYPMNTDALENVKAFINILKQENNKDPRVLMILDNLQARLPNPSPTPYLAPLSPQTPRRTSVFKKS
jgi:hypothetical protein